MSILFALDTNLTAEYLDPMCSTWWPGPAADGAVRLYGPGRNIFTLHVSKLKELMAIIEEHEATLAKETDKLPD